MNVARLLRDALARTVAVREALEDGDSRYAYELATDLEQDLAASLRTVGDSVIRVTLDDFNAFPAAQDDPGLAAA